MTWSQRPFRPLRPSRELQRAELSARMRRALRASLATATPGVVRGSDVPEVSDAQVRAIYANLVGAACVCGANKTRRQSFCRANYFSLPVGLRRALYNEDPRSYAAAFLRACEFLKLEAPTATEKA